MRDRSTMSRILVLQAIWVGLMSAVLLAEEIPIDVWARITYGPVENPAMPEETVRTGLTADHDNDGVSQEAIANGPTFLWEIEAAEYSVQTGEQGWQAAGGDKYVPDIERPINPETEQPDTSTPVATLKCVIISGGYYWRVRCKVTVMYDGGEGDTWKGTDTVIISGVVPSITLDSLSPDAYVDLGTDLSVNYRIAPAGYSFGSAELLISNASETVVYKATGIPAAAGDPLVTRIATWAGAKWNQAPHGGAFANPRNGPYRPQVVGINGARQWRSNRLPIGTKLVIEIDIKDVPPPGASATRDAGLHDLASILKVYVKKQGGGDEVWADTLTVSGASSDLKHVKAESASPTGGINNVSNGTYDVEFRKLRDAIGNFSDADSNPANGIQPLKFSIDLF